MRSKFRLREFNPLRLNFPDLFDYLLLYLYDGPQPHSKLWFGLFPVRSPLLGESMFLSLPRGT